MMFSSQGMPFCFVGVGVGEAVDRAECGADPCRHDSMGILVPSDC